MPRQGKRMRAIKKLMMLLVACAAVVSTASPSRADAIDGEWCLATNHFEIQGSDIRTPGGSRITGNYSRHGFTYVVPANEAGAGTEIVLILLNEETVQVTRSGASSPEIWRRCKATS